MATIAALLWLACLANILHDVAEGKGFPLGDKFPAFEDIVIYRTRFQLFHTRAFFQPVVHSPRFQWPPPGFAYPPAAAVVYAVLYSFGDPTYLFLTIMAGWTVVMCWGAWWMLRRSTRSATLVRFYAGCLVLFSFPLIFLAQRSNIELFVWMLLAAATLLYLRGHKITVAVLIGIAASIKIYPILLLGIFLGKRPRWQALALGVAVAIAATFAALWFSGPTIPVAFHGFYADLAQFNAQHAETARRTEAIFDHSLFSPVKLLYMGARQSPLQWTTLYYVLAAAFAGGLFLLRVRKLPFLNRLVFLTVAMITLPPVSYGYTIAHLYLPLLLLLCTALRQSQQEGTSMNGGAAAVLCILMTMTPLALWGGGTFLYAGEVQLAALVMVALLAAMFPWNMRAEIPQ